MTKRLLNICTGRIHLSERVYPVSVGEVITVKDEELGRGDIQDAISRGWLAVLSEEPEQVVGFNSTSTIGKSEPESKPKPKPKQESLLVETIESIGEAVVEVLADEIEEKTGSKRGRK